MSANLSTLLVPLPLDGAGDTAENPLPALAKGSWSGCLGSFQPLRPHFVLRWVLSGPGVEKGGEGLYLMPSMDVPAQPNPMSWGQS